MGTIAHGLKRMLTSNKHNENDTITGEANTAACSANDKHLRSASRCTSRSFHPTTLSGLIANPAVLGRSAQLLGVIETTTWANGNALLVLETFRLSNRNMYW